MILKTTILLDVTPGKNWVKGTQMPLNYFLKLRMNLKLCPIKSLIKKFFKKPSKNSCLLKNIIQTRWHDTNDP